MAARMLTYRSEQERDLGRAALGFAPVMNDRLGSTNSAAPAGVCDRGQGEHFEVSLARALTTLREAAPSLVRELELTWRFSVSPELRYVPRVEHGCSARGDVPVCATMVRESEAFAVAQRETALSVSVGFMAGDG
jgi:hypothetical protein